MPSKTEAAALQDILDHIDPALRFTQGTDSGAFQADTLRLYAVTRCPEIISEASRRLSIELKSRHPEIPWREMAGAGNIYRHDYEGISARRVWDTVAYAPPPLRRVVEQEIERSR